MELLRRRWYDTTIELPLSTKSLVLLLLQENHSKHKNDLAFLFKVEARW